MTAAHSSELQLVRCVRACAGVGDCLAAPATVEVRQSLGGSLRPSRSDPSGVRCRVRTELERLTRFESLRTQLLQCTVGRFIIVCYGCMSVCELNNCKKPLMRFELADATRYTVWPSHAGCARARVLGQTSNVTWLILPVVICLSQRLSHACLSISLYTVKLRMAH